MRVRNVKNQSPYDVLSVSPYAAPSVEKLIFLFYPRDVVSCRVLLKSTVVNTSDRNREPVGTRLSETRFRVMAASWNCFNLFYDRTKRDRRAAVCNGLCPKRFPVARVTRYPNRMITVSSSRSLRRRRGKKKKRKP